MKEQLRKNILQKLKTLDLHKKQIIEEKIQAQLFQQFFWKQAKVIGLTHSTSYEWDTKVIIKRAWLEGKTVVLPKCNRKLKKLHFLQINDLTELEVGYADILEPKQTNQSKVMNQYIDLLIVPGLLFDIRGYRLGFGGGFYDRYLVEQDHQATTVSLASEFQL